MEKIKELLNKNKKITGIVAVTLCALVVIVVALAATGGNGSLTMQKRRLPTLKRMSLRWIETPS